MADTIKSLELQRTLFVDDGEKRGPMTMARLRFHPREAKLLAQVVDRRIAWFDLDTEPVSVPKKKEKYVVGELVCPHEIGWVRGFDVHPEGASIVTGGSDRSLRLWNCENGKPGALMTQVADAHSGWVEGVAFAPDGKRLISVGADKLVKVWNSADLSPVKSLAGHDHFVLDVAIARNGESFVTGCEGGKVIVWDADALTAKQTIDFGFANDQFGQIPRHSGVHRLAISRDDRWLAVAGGEVVQVYNLETGELVAGEKCEMDVAFHPSSDVLAGGENEVRFWNFEGAAFMPPKPDKNGKPTKPAAIAAKPAASIKRGDWSLGMCFSPTGDRVALGKSDGTIEIHKLV